MTKFPCTAIAILAVLALTGCPETTVHNTGADSAVTPDGSAVQSQAGTAGGPDDAGGAGGTGGGSGAAGTGGATRDLDGGSAGTTELDDEDAGAAQDAESDTGAQCSCLDQDQCCDGCDAIKEGQPCEGAELECADNLCRAGSCAQEIKAGFCLIDGVCYSDSENNPEEPCQFCDTVFSNQSWRNKPQAVECDDGLFCNGADTCDSSGKCAVHEGDPCASGDACNNQCDEDTHLCLSPQGSPCGDQSDDICSAPDTCDGEGVCQPNHAESGAPCGDETDDQCTAPDACDGEGLCQPNHAEEGTSCGDQTDAECTAPDTCDGQGVCEPNHAEEGAQCFGQDWMLYDGQCNADGMCEGTHYCDTHPCWSIPPTGVSYGTCYDNEGQVLDDCDRCDEDGAPEYCGQDEHYAANAREFELIAGAGYRDTLSHLIWALSSESESMGWFACESACDAKVVGDDADWRMPDYYELFGAMSFKSCDYADGLPGSVETDAYYWTATEDAFSPGSAWIVVRAVSCGAAGGSQPTTGSFFCRCVRGEQLSRNDVDGARFVSTGGTGEQVVMDRATGLLWQKSYVDSSSEMDWKAALAHCGSSTYGGHNDWRLPDINELFSLVNVGIRAPASEFPGMPSLVFASSTTVVGLPSSAWVVNLSDGSTNGADKSSTNFAVRCVRCGLGDPCGP